MPTYHGIATSASHCTPRLVHCISEIPHLFAIWSVVRHLCASSGSSDNVGLRRIEGKGRGVDDTHTYRRKVDRIGDLSFTQRCHYHLVSSVHPEPWGILGMSRTPHLHHSRIRGAAERELVFHLTNVTVPVSSGGSGGRGIVRGGRRCIVR